MQIEVAYVSAFQGEREDRPEDDKGNTGCDGYDASPFRGWIVSSGSESGGITGGRQACRHAVGGRRCGAWVFTGAPTGVTGRCGW
jgi:hypothetical protein